MANLINFQFTNESDYATSASGWVVDYGEVVRMLAGDDEVSSSLFSGSVNAIQNYGTIDAGSGNDSLIGITEIVPGGYGVGIDNVGTIKMGSGNDYVYGRGFDLGIWNRGLLDLGEGNDKVIGIYDQCGLLNTGTIWGGNGLDEIYGYGIDHALENHGSIYTGNDNDLVFGGAIRTGSSQVNRGIVQGDDNIIDTGDGDDVVHGEGTGAWGVSGIYNNGKIFLGKGNDTIDAITGGFDGYGVTDCGAGNDLVKGFGGGEFLGGKGVDTLLFESGVYSIQDAGGGGYMIGERMLVSGFEFFGAGANVSSFAEAAAQGSVTFG